VICAVRAATGNFDGCLDRAYANSKLYREPHQMTSGKTQASAVRLLQGGAQVIACFESMQGRDRRGREERPRLTLVSVSSVYKPVPICKCRQCTISEQFDLCQLTAGGLPTLLAQRLKRHTPFCV